MISKNHQNLIDQVINFKTEADKDLYQKKIIYDYLSSINKPIVLEFGVNTGASSSIFTYVAEKNNGKVYSIDIQDCKDVIVSDNWFFLQTNDLETKKILNTFTDLANGIDIIYIDSYHDSEHVKKLIYNWFPYLKKKGVMFLDDTDNLIYREKKLIPHSINVGEINKIIDKIYFSNHDRIVYSKIYGSSGLSKYLKITEIGDKLKPISNVWDVNFFIKFFYIYLRKIFNFFKKK